MVTDLEAYLARLRSTVSDPRAGIFGPTSVVWRINREAVIFLGGGAAALLQLAHPAVAHAVDQHSTTRTDPLGRFLRTFERVFAMVYGDLDEALDAARRVHAIHSRVVGTVAEDTGAYRAGAPYAANDPEALLWVHATLWDTSIQVYELVAGPLPAVEKAAYYEETKRFAALFGIPDDAIPPTWEDFRAYVCRMVDGPAVAVGTPAREMATFLLRPPGSLAGPLWEWQTIVTAGLLPERLRHEYRLPFGRLEQGVFAASVATIRRTWWGLPSRLRFLPAYRRALRRLDGSAPDLLDDAIDWTLGRVAGPLLGRDGSGAAGQPRHPRP